MLLFGVQISDRDTFIRFEF